VGKIKDIENLGDPATIADAKAGLSSQLHSFVLIEKQDAAVSGGATASTVIEYLIEKLEFDPNSWEQRIAIGGLYFNGLRLNQDRQLSYPCKIEYYDPRFSLEDPYSFFPQITEENIFYRAKGLIAIFKPSGLPSMPAKDQRLFNLKDQLSKLLGEKADLHLPSRIDTSVSGLVLLSEERVMHNKLQQLYAGQKIQKEYLAIVSPGPESSELEIDLPIGRSKQWGVLRAIDPEHGKKSLTLVKKLRDMGERLSLLKVTPKTGRTHQIRLHLSASGFPIVGDRFYCGLMAPELCLLSRSVVFNHPIEKMQLSIEVPVKFLPSWVPQH
jgi:23S rRNA-/tRNA-specific pseudouridylate synthase